FQKLGFHQSCPRRVSPTSSRYNRSDLCKRETGVLAEPDQRYPLGGGGTVKPSSVGSPVWREQSNSLVVAQRPSRQSCSATQLTYQKKSGRTRHDSPLDLKWTSTWMIRDSGMSVKSRRRK